MRVVVCVLENYYEVINMHAHAPLSLIATILLVAVLGAVPATALAAGAGETAMFRYNAQHTGDYSLVAGGRASDDRLNWNYMTGGTVESSPAVANGVVYVGSHDHNIYALDAETGAKVWSYATGDRIFSSPTVTNGVVFVGSNDKNVYASQCGNRGEGVELCDRRRCVVFPCRRQRDRLRGGLGPQRLRP